MGGTELSSIDDARKGLVVPEGDLAVGVPLVGVGFLLRRGRVKRRELLFCSLAAGVGGVLPVFAVGGASGAGGVGRGGGAGLVLGCFSDALDPRRGRPVLRIGRCCETVKLGRCSGPGPLLLICDMMVGEAVCCRLYLGRWSR